MKHHHDINYVEFPARDIEATKSFFSTVFDWRFIDYGPDYSAFSGKGLDGGVFRADLQATTATGSALLVIYSTAIAATLAQVEAAGGIIVRPIFAFPGGRRFHFTEPSGNELAVWSDLP